MNLATGSITALTAATDRYNVTISKGYNADGPATFVDEVPVIAWAVVVIDNNDDPDDGPKTLTTIEPVVLLKGVPLTGQQLLTDYGQDYGIEVTPG